MGLVDKLTEVDEKIWHGFEKVTQYCNKEYGWNKYDLARISHAAVCTSIAGGGIYSGLSYVIGQGSPLRVASSTIITLAGITNYYSARIEYNKEEQEEAYLLEKTGAAKQPHFSAVRPFSFLLPPLITGLAIHSFTQESSYVPEGLSLPPEEYNTLSGLFYLAFSSAILFRTCRSYFEDQIMTPPKKKKKVIKTLLEKAKGKVTAAPVPQLEESKYQSIDNIVEGA